MKAKIEILFDEDVWEESDEEQEGCESGEKIAGEVMKMFGDSEHVSLDWRDSRTLWIHLSFPAVIGGIGVKEVS